MFWIGNWSQMGSYWPLRFEFVPGFCCTLTLQLATKATEATFHAAFQALAPARFCTLCKASQQGAMLPLLPLPPLRWPKAAPGEGVRQRCSMQLPRIGRVQPIQPVDGFPKTCLRLSLLMFIDHQLVAFGMTQLVDILVTHHNSVLMHWNLACRLTGIVLLLPQCSCNDQSGNAREWNLGHIRTI